VTLLVDSRLGDSNSRNKSFYHYLPSEKAILTQLEYGDVAFEANGTTIGIECKRVADAVNCMYSGRLADHQIPGLKRSYDVCYLLVEGIWRADPDSGVLQHYRGELGKWGKWVDSTSGIKRTMFDSFTNWLNTLTMMGGVSLLSTPDSETTASTLLSLYKWWSKSSHGSFQVMQQQTGVELSRPTMLRRMIALLPRIGWDRSGILCQRFGSVADLSNAAPEEFMIEGQIAMPTAVRIWEAIHGVPYEQTSTR
jgi:ERCC4-type nuclease